MPNFSNKNFITSLYRLLTAPFQMPEEFLKMSCVPAGRRSLAGSRCVAGTESRLYELALTVIEAIDFRSQQNGLEVEKFRFKN